MYLNRNCSRQEPHETLTVQINKIHITCWKPYYGIKEPVNNFNCNYLWRRWEITSTARHNRFHIYRIWNSEWFNLSGECFKSILLYYFLFGWFWDKYHTKELTIKILWIEFWCMQSSYCSFFKTLQK